MKTLDIVFKSMGLSGAHTELSEHLEQEMGIPAEVLLRTEPRPYPVTIIGKGITLMMHHRPQGETDADNVWGLQSIYMDNSSWKARWLQDLEPGSVTNEQVVTLLAKDREQAFIDPDLTSFTMEDDKGRTWSAVAIFEGAGKGLLSLTFSRMGDWVPIPPAITP